MNMHKTSVEIDLDALKEAEKNLGTTGFKETINRALDEINRRAWLERAAQVVRDGRLVAPDWDTFRANRAGRAGPR